MPSLREILRLNPQQRTDIRVILAKITGYSPAQLISRDEYCLTKQQYACYQEYLARLNAGEPVAYIIGYREFYSRLFRVTPATLIPRPETELLVDEVLKRAHPNANILDLGTGSGCIAISLQLERPDLMVLALDKFSEALNIAQQNADELGALINFQQSDWYSAVAAAKFDIIASNPPYIEKDDEHLMALSYEPQSALTDFSDGLSCIVQIAEGSISHLNDGGWLLVEHGFLQGALVRQIFAAAGLVAIATVCDYANLERITLGRKPIN